jgi:hypothetical protein
VTTADLYRRLSPADEFRATSVERSPFRRGTGEAGSRWSAAEVFAAGPHQLVQSEDARTPPSPPPLRRRPAAPVTETSPRDRLRRHGLLRCLPPCPTSAVPRPVPPRRRFRRVLLSLRPLLVLPLLRRYLSPLTTANLICLFTCFAVKVFSKEEYSEEMINTCRQEVDIYIVSAFMFLLYQCPLHMYSLSVMETVIN